jgi:hypothetical protein
MSTRPRARRKLQDNRLTWISAALASLASWATYVYSIPTPARSNRNGSIADTCRQIRLERRRVYDWLEADPEFATALKDAEVEALDRLRGAAHKRASSRSDGMLMFLLKRLQPEVFAVGVLRRADGTARADGI